MTTHKRRLSQPHHARPSCEAKSFFFAHFAGWVDCVLTSLLMGDPFAPPIRNGARLQK